MLYDAESIYEEVKTILESKLMTVTFDTWFRDLVPVAVEGKTLILQTDKPLAKDLIPMRFTKDIADCFAQLNYEDFTFKIISPDEYDPEAQKKEDDSLHALTQKANLNPRYTFDNFVEGANNRLAYASSVAVADYPGNTYNPLFVWGGSGLGKTHLMHSIGHHILKNDPAKKVLYVSSETFMNELINSISNNTSTKFRDKYRQIDVLLIDDIQFLGGKEGTQDEFFHTFNTLYEANKQIVISGDRPPEEIERLEERIRSRFKWGLIVDIKPPDYETRVAILQKKAKINELNIDLSVLSYIADNIASNIRELEGALTRVVAYARLTCPGKNIDVEMAREALKDFTDSDSQKAITVHRIMETVCERYNLRMEDMESKKRTKELAYPRQIAMYMCRKLTDVPLANIGKDFGGRDHTTVIHACEKVTEDLNGDHGDELRRSLEDIERRIVGE